MSAHPRIGADAKRSVLIAHLAEHHGAEGLVGYTGSDAKLRRFHAGLHRGNQIMRLPPRQETSRGS